MLEVVCLCATRRYTAGDWKQALCMHSSIYSLKGTYGGVGDVSFHTAGKNAHFFSSQKRLKRCTGHSAISTLP